MTTDCCVRSKGVRRSESVSLEKSTRDWKVGEGGMREGGGTGWQRPCDGQESGEFKD